MIKKVLEYTFPITFLNETALYKNVFANPTLVTCEILTFDIYTGFTNSLRYAQIREVLRMIFLTSRTNNSLEIKEQKSKTLFIARVALGNEAKMAFWTFHLASFTINKPTLMFGFIVQNIRFFAGITVS
jgi:hypothetical protein